MNTTEIDYLHRNVTASFSLLLVEDVNVQIEVKRKLNGDSNLADTITEVVQEAGANFLRACETVTLPVNPLPGDHPLVQLNLEYFHYLDEPEESLTLSNVATSVIDPGELNRAIAEASNQAKAVFARKLPALLSA